MTVRSRLGAVRRRLRRTPSVPSALDQLRERGVVEIGKMTYGNPRVIYYKGDDARVRIGSYCSIAAGVELMPGGGHRTDWISTFPFRVMLEMEGALTDGHPSSKGDIVIGHDVWIGFGARILSGVSVGNGAVIGSGAVVASDVGAYEIVAGNPARVLRTRFEPEIVAALERCAWWDLPDEQVRSLVPVLNGGSPMDLLRILDQLPAAPVANDVSDEQ